MKLDFKLDLSPNRAARVKNISSRDIAIIGVALRLPKSGDAAKFWHNIRNGIDCTNDIAEERRYDLENYLKHMGLDSGGSKYLAGSYIDDIDKFDNKFFGISAKEASLMDPSQRLFLETAYRAVEDSGYGGNKLAGSKTGVYVGFNSENSYQQAVFSLQPELASMARTGNLKSVVAGRVAYFMDFKGPSLLIDTACSSSLVAVHMACQGIRNGECNMAVAGGVNIYLFPIGKEIDLGIESSSGKTKTFDDSSDGTIFGEGVAAVLLKPLSDAVRDRDNIYAVIKGSAVNQDGNSVGMAAPNVLAQEEVIVKAWEDAGIDPETITYIEAHGTGTKLGDPIEARGIQKAFERYTNKRQFCAVGTVKTNMGHLDYSAGIAGMLKAVMALKNREIPPIVHFKNPNRKIDFENTPLYVNDRVEKWETDGFPRRCGISSFGLSGTNCHIVLEEPPEIDENKNDGIKGYNILTLSAKNKKSLKRIIARFMEHITRTEDKYIEDICYTANTGRGQYSLRLAVLFQSREELLEKLHKSTLGELGEVGEEDLFYGESSEIRDNTAAEAGAGAARSGKSELTALAGQKVLYINSYAGADLADELRELLRLYVKGAEIDWDELYKGRGCRRLSLPGYAFDTRRCWVEAGSTGAVRPLQAERTYKKEIAHPLIGRRLCESINQDVYESLFDVDSCWVVKEHNILGSFFPPGTTYLEMVREISRCYFGDIPIEIKDILFVSPIIVRPGEAVEVQTIIKKELNSLEFIIAARLYDKAANNGQWTKCAEGKVYKAQEHTGKRFNIGEAKSRMQVSELDKKDFVIQKDKFNVGDRWNKIKTDYYIGEDDFLVELELDREFYGDLKEYWIHPSLMDTAVNAVSQNQGKSFYLPLAYASITIRDCIPAKILCYIKNPDRKVENPETRSFDILIMNPDGEVICDITKYTVKKVHEDRFAAESANGKNAMYYETAWTPAELQAGHGNENRDKTVVLITSRGENGEVLYKGLQDSGYRTVKLTAGQSFERKGSGEYSVNGSLEDYTRVFEELRDKAVGKLVYAVQPDAYEDILTPGHMEECLNKSVYGVFNLVKALVSSKISQKAELVLISGYANEVDGQEQQINPFNAAIASFGRVVSNEYGYLRCRCIDIDNKTDILKLIPELENTTGIYSRAYRNGKRYEEEFRGLAINTLEHEEIVIKDGGVYVITGGNGGIGLEVAKYLASVKKVNIIFINRRGIPPREMWDSLLPEGSPKDIRLIEAVCEIEKVGSCVEAFRADVSDFEGMKQVIGDIRLKYGRINGLIHSAGIAGDGFIFKKDIAKVRSVLLPKVHGTWVLDKLTDDFDMDFFVVFSSVSSLLGEAGQSDYAAANSFLNSFSMIRNKRGKRTMAISWGAWSETGMAVDNNVKGRNIFKTLSTEAGIKAFAGLLKSGARNAVVGEIDYDFMADMDSEVPFRLEDKIRLLVEKKRNRNNGGKTAAAHKRDGGRNAAEGKTHADHQQIEQVLTGIWADVLGEDEIDIHESFYNLGGDSIIATQILKKIEREYPGTIDITDIFTYPSISELSGHIKSLTGSKAQEERAEDSSSGEIEEGLDDILDRLEKGMISSDEAEKISSGFWEAK